MEAEIKAEQDARMAHMAHLTAVTSVTGSATRIVEGVGTRIMRLNSRHESAGEAKAGEKGEAQETASSAESEAIEMVPPAPSSAELVQAEEGDAPKETVLGEAEEVPENVQEPRRASAQLTDEELLNRRMQVTKATLVSLELCSLLACFSLVPLQ